MGDALEAVPFHVEKLTAPDGAVEAISGAVPGNAEVSPFDVIFGGARRHVRLMVLDADDREACVLGPMR